jgi:hypothetical protein
VTIISATQLVGREASAAFASRMSELEAPPITLAVGNEALSVYFEDPQWRVRFAERYADQLVERSSLGLRHYVVRNGSGYAFWSAGYPKWCWENGELPADAIAFLSDATAMSALFSGSKALVTFHAAAVVTAGIAAAIAGDSNAGKTTTALACGRAGLQLYSDERCVVDGRAVVPFMRSLSVRSDGWSRLHGSPNQNGALPKGARPTIDGFSIRISELFGNVDRSTRPELRAVFALDGAAEQARVTPVAWYDVAPTLAKWMNSADRGLNRGVRLIETLRSVECFRLRLGTPHQSAALIGSTLRAIAEHRAS